MQRHTHTHTQTHTHKNTHTHTHTHTHTDTHTDRRTQRQTHTETDAHLNTCAHTHTHTHPNKNPYILPTNADCLLTFLTSICSSEALKVTLVSLSVKQFQIITFTLTMLSMELRFKNLDFN